MNCLFFLLVILFGSELLFLFVSLRDVVQAFCPVLVKVLNFLHQRVHHVEISLRHFVPGPPEQLELICDRRNFV